MINFFIEIIVFYDNNFCFRLFFLFSPLDRLRPILNPLYGLILRLSTSEKSIYGRVC